MIVLQQSLSDRLAFYRINSGYSKEDLAQKIGVSVDVITQWEIGSATPDVQEVLSLSNLYGVSVDDILRSQVRPNDVPRQQFYENTTQNQYNANAQSDTYNANNQSASYNTPPQGNAYNVPPQGNAQQNSQQWEETVNAAAGDFVKKVFKNGFRVFGGALAPTTARLMFVFPFPLIVVAVYLFAGSVLHLWHPAWILFLLIPCYYMIAASLKAKSFKSFLFIQPVPIVIVMLFLIFGFMFHIWHPTWMLFLLIPIYYWSVAVFVRRRRW